MDREELKKESAMSLQELYAYLKKKYGHAPENYFLDVKCTRKSAKNGRGNEGLYLHHDYEYDPANSLVNNLSSPEMAWRFDYMYQHAENLTYCNYLEHLIIHIKINLLRKEQLGHYINDGLVNFMIPELNDWYKYLVDLKPWQEAAFDLIKDNYMDYCDLVEGWLRDLGIDPANYGWKRFTSRKSKSSV